MDQSAANGRADASAGARQYLTFAAGGEVMAVRLAGLREILEAAEPRPAPGLPPAICGWVAAAGQAVPVLDLAARFGRRPAPGAQRCVLLLETARPVGRGTCLGALVDGVLEVVTIDDAHIQAPPALAASGRPGYLSGIADLGHRYVAILDIEALLTREEIAAIGNVMAAL